MISYLVQHWAKKTFSIFIQNPPVNVREDSRIARILYLMVTDSISIPFYPREINQTAWEYYYIFDKKTVILMSKIWKLPHDTGSCDDNAGICPDSMLPRGSTVHLPPSVLRLSYFKITRSTPRLLMLFLIVSTGTQYCCWLCRRNRFLSSTQNDFSGPRHLIFGKL